MVPEELSAGQPKQLISQSNHELKNSPRAQLARFGFVEKAGREWTRRFEPRWQKLARRVSVIHLQIGQIVVAIKLSDKRSFYKPVHAIL